MSFAELKKRVPELYDKVLLNGTHASSVGANEMYNGIFKLIEELEKEDLIFRKGVEKEHFLELVRRLGEPLWSGRSEAEIRERIRVLREQLEKVGGYSPGIGELEWVLFNDKKLGEGESAVFNGDLKVKNLSPEPVFVGYDSSEKKELPTKEMWRTASCSKCMTHLNSYDDEELKTWVANHKCEVSSAPKEKLHECSTQNMCVDCETEYGSKDLGEGVPVFTLSEMAELMEKIATSPFYRDFVQEKFRVRLPEETRKQMDDWASFVWLFRERPDLVEKFRRGN